jgi:hypothetical protein
MPPYPLAAIGDIIMVAHLTTILKRLGTAAGHFIDRTARPPAQSNRKRRISWLLPSV